MPRNEIVYLTDDAIGSMVSNKDFVDAFEVVRRASGELQKLRGCSRCQSGSKRANILNTLKQNIRGMSGTDMLKLKQLLDTKKIRFRTKDANGKIIEWTA